MLPDIVVADEKTLSPKHDESSAFEAEDLINVSGHVQELDRSFSLWSACGLSVVADNAWNAGASSLVVALYNGGGPGVMYGLIAATFFYCFIGASLAELASAIPSSANVYHWASVTPGPRFGRVCSFFAGWWNALAWTFGCSVPGIACGNAVMAMYTLYHPGFVPQRWQIFIVFLFVTWTTSSLVLFGQRILAKALMFFGILVILLFFIITVVLATMPARDGSYASNAFVWTDWQNLSGYSSNGFVFLAGMLNGAFAIGTPDGACHLCEEMPRPKVNVPWAIFAQMTTGFVTTFVFYMVCLYGITNLDDLFNSSIPSLPVAGIFQQAVKSDAATLGILILFMLGSMIGTPGAYIAASRMLWTLGRDKATPFPNFIGKISPRFRNPFNAQIAVSCTVTVLGCVYIGSEVAFNAFVGAFTIFTTLSYVAAILPHILTARKYVKPGPFWMPGIWAYIVMGTASAYIILFDVIWMFPFAMPFNIDVMNWNCVIVGGITFLLIPWYLWIRTHGYVGPHVEMNAHDNIMTGHIGMDQKLEARRRASAVQK